MNCAHTREEKLLAASLVCPCCTGLVAELRAERDVHEARAEGWKASAIDALERASKAEALLATLAQEAP